MGNDINLDKIFEERFNFSDILYVAVSALLDEKTLKNILFDDELNRLKDITRNVDLEELQGLASYIGASPVQCD